MVFEKVAQKEDWCYNYCLILEKFAQKEDMVLHALALAWLCPQQV